MLHHPARLYPCVVAVFVSLAVGGCHSTAGGGHASRVASHSGDARQEISSLLDQYTQALLKKDLAALNRIWADDLTFINARGELLGKQDRLNNIKTGATSFKTIELTERWVRVYDEAAIATFQVGLEAQYSGQEGNGNYRVTTVWVRMNQAWQMSAVHMTRITP